MKYTERLFVPERFHRIYVHRSTCRHITGQQRHGEQYGGHADERHRIGWLHAKEHAGHKSRQYECRYNADNYAYQRHACAISQHHAHSNLLRALSYQIGKHPVDPDAGQHQRQTGKEREQRHGEALTGNRTQNSLLHILHVKHNHLVTQFQDSMTKSLKAHRTGTLQAKENVPAQATDFQVFVWYLSEGQIQLCMQWTGSIGVQSPLVHMANYADDLRVGNFVGFVRSTLKSRY